MTPEYVLRKSLCREPHCANKDTYVRSATSEIENMGWATEYAEPGYTQPAKGILFANWNYFPRGIDSILERYGYQVEWSDEWSTCEGCGKAVRTSPDCYGWQPSYALVNECEIVCKDCLAADPTDYLKSLEDNPRTALNMPAIDPAECGYTLVQDDFENGLHQGQTDDPKKIFSELQAKGIRHILFRIDSVGQFDMRFSVWTRDMA